MTDSSLILARSGAPLGALRSSLTELGLTPVLLDELPTEQPLGESLLRAVDDATFVIVVWDVTRVSRSTMFAAGYAVARSARIALLDARTRRSVTDDPLVDELLAFPRLNAPLSSEQLLSQELSAFLELPYSEPALYRKSRQPSGMPLQAEGSGLEGRVVAALRSVDLRSVSARTASLEIPDWKVWVARFTPPFNPVFVEVTGRLSHQDRKRKQLVRAMNTSGAHLGVLITADDVEPRVDIDGLTAVCTLSVTDLESAPEQFEDLLRIARNRLLHSPR